MYGNNKCWKGITDAFPAFPVFLAFQPTPRPAQDSRSLPPSRLSKTLRGSKLALVMRRRGMPKHIGLFKMRRLEALSNTIFGVAMTLLAYDLPKASGFAKAPVWMDLVRAYAQPVVALMISFIVAGLFWFSHHRRLAIAAEGSRGVVFLNLLFLLSIIMLPVTNGL